MKKMYGGILFVLVICGLCGCALINRTDKSYQAAQIMYDIKSSIYLNENRYKDEQKSQQAVYDFSDLFSDEAYAGMGDLTDAYMQIHSYYGTSLQAFDLQKVAKEGDILRAIYKIENDKGSSYLCFVADVSDFLHKRGVRFLHIADDMDTVEKEENQEYGIRLNGVDIAPHADGSSFPMREKPVTYRNKKDYARGDSDEFAKEIADEFMSYLQQGDAVKIKNMFSGSVWRYDLQLESEIETFIEEYKDLAIESYTSSVTAESGSTSYSNIKNSEGKSFGTQGHGVYSVSLTIIMQTGQGEQEIDLQVVSEYEPNPGRVGLAGVSDEKVSVGIEFNL